MVTRRPMSRLALILLLILAAGCGTPDLDRDDVAGVVTDAFAEADLAVESVEVGAEPVDGRWPADVVVDGRSLAAAVDAGSGRVTSLDLGTGIAPFTEEQLEAVASHADNPAADAARRRQIITVVLLAVLLVAGGLAVARQLRLREEAQLGAEV